MDYYVKRTKYEKTPFIILVWIERIHFVNCELEYKLTRFLVYEFEFDLTPYYDECA